MSISEWRIETSTGSNPSASYSRNISETTKTNRNQHHSAIRW